MNTQLRIEEASAEKIKKIAEQSRRSFNSQILFIIDRFIEDYEKVNGKIEITK